MLLMRSLFRLNDYILNDLAIHLIAIASFNPNGYTRQKALKYLGNLKNKECLPYIFLRLSDWVWQVRDEARKALEKHKNVINIEDIINHIDLIERVRRSERDSFGPILEILKKVILVSINRKDFFSCVQKASFRAQYFCWKILLEHPTEELLNIALKDSYPEIREIAAKKVPHDYKFLILVNEKSVRVKNAAIRAIPEDQLEAYKHIFEKGIYDRSASIRNYCRFVLKKLGHDDVVKLYREKILENNSSKSILLGFSETALLEDINLLLQFINHVNGAVRSSVLLALERLNYSQNASLLLNGISDSSNIVRNRCVNILQKEHKFLKKDLREILQNGNDSSQKSALKILSTYDALEALRNILFAIDNINPNLSNLGWHMLKKWMKCYGCKLWFSFSQDVFFEIKCLVSQIKGKIIGYDQNILIKEMEHILDIISKNS